MMNNCANLQNNHLMTPNIPDMFVWAIIFTSQRTISRHINLGSLRAWICSGSQFSLIITRIPINVTMVAERKTARSASSQAMIECTA